MANKNVITGLVVMTIVTLSAIPPARSASINWVPEYRTITCGGDLALNVEWPDATPPDVMLGVEPAAGLGDSVQLDLAVVPPPRLTSAQTTVVFQNVNARLTQTGPCSVSLSATSGEERRLVLHARVAPDRRVKLRVNNKTVVNFVAGGDGIIVYDGKVVTDRGKLYGLKALAAIYTRAFETPPDDVVRASNGHYLITATGFRNHAIETPQVLAASHRPQGCCSNAVIVTVRIGVSPTGDIVSAVPGSGVPADKAANLMSIVSGLKLKPFQSSGTPVYAEGMMSLLMDSSGAVSYFH